MIRNKDIQVYCYNILMLVTNNDSSCFCCYYCALNYILFTVRLEYNILRMTFRDSPSPLLATEVIKTGKTTRPD